MGIKTDDYGNPCRIFIQELLTPMRARACKKLREDKVQHYVRNGNIRVNIGGSEWKVLDTLPDWNALGWSEKVKRELGIYPKE